MRLVGIFGTDPEETGMDRIRQAGDVTDDALPAMPVDQPVPT